MGAQCCSSEGGSPLEDSSDPASTAKGPVGEGFPPDSVVKITISGVRGLDKSTWRANQGPNKPYCVCEMIGKGGKSFGTKVQTPPGGGDGTRDITWNFEEVLTSYVFPNALLFTVFDEEFDSPADHLGKAQVSANRLEAGSGNFSGDLPLGGIDDISSTPMLSVKIEAVPRPEPSAFEQAKSRAPAELPTGRMVRMGIHLKEGQKMGCALEERNKEIVVAEIKSDGAAADYNRGKKVQEQLQVGDCILEVNGMRTLDAVIKELSTQSHIELLVECRAYIFKANVLVSDEVRLGMELFYQSDHEELAIDAIKEDAAVHIYNNTAPEEKQVLKGDHIIAVNGVQTPKERLEEMQKARGHVELLIRRVGRVVGLPKSSDKA